MSIEKCWSSSGDEFSDDLDYTLEVASEDSNNGDVIIIQEGVAIKPFISEFIHADWIMENICENVFENRGEHADAWICAVEDVSKEQYDKLESELSRVVKKWLTENDCEINFYDVRDIQEIQYRVINADNHEYERFN
ncbi:MAG: hypothetical protein Tp1111DCM1126091_47 [Prokaryotic dsDNA virus sp.]|nr:MAG: hypothetical protein Tp1111DCM1126091_47 [Prokaryotic dsDNA virus sp.]|tara:strand:+ start:81582 stop:81992 length:411 start_codon:yes stop_codon:yes gene_type:complete